MSKDNNKEISKDIYHNSNFGKNLDKILDQLDIKRIDLARAIGVSKSTISNICNGRNYPHMSTIVKICSFLHIDIETLTSLDPKLELITESAEAYSILKDSLVSIGALKEDEEIKKEQLELLEKLIKDNKKLYQEPDKALESAKLIIVPLETFPNND